MKIYRIFSIIGLFPLVALTTGCITENSVCPPGAIEPGFHWESFNIYPLNDYRWTTTRTNKSIAVTNPDKKTQIMVTWEGGMSSGKKENARLKISQNGELPQETPLKTFILTTDEEKETCCVSFTGLENQEGSIKIPL